MLKRVGGEINPRGAEVAIQDASFPAPFASGLEYATPARGTWNIVHTGMLIPEAHEIFVCAAGCLRGVVLTAAELHAEHRFSTVAVREHNLLDGDMEELVIEGVSEIIEKLPKRPPAVLVYTSCIHHFAGCDLDMIYRELRERFPEIDFTDCYMNPIMRKSGLTPDQIMRSRLYALLKEREKNEHA
ncbi:MAG: nitrogenase, partial [Lachnospiraceae bacterium]|nr:nitrogenase [Lachnospiraceae bacterium]